MLSIVDLAGKEIRHMLEDIVEKVFSTVPMKHMGGEVKRAPGINQEDLPIKAVEVMETFLLRHPRDSAAPRLPAACCSPAEVIATQQCCHGIPLLVLSAGKPSHMGHR